LNDIKQKAKELETIMAEYKGTLSNLEKELFQALSDYQKALDQEKIKELKEQLTQSP
jgi:hypothetical protein